MWWGHCYWVSVMNHQNSDRAIRFWFHRVAWDILTCCNDAEKSVFFQIYIKEPSKWLTIAGTWLEIVVRKQIKNITAEDETERSRKTFPRPHLWVKGLRVWGHAPCYGVGNTKPDQHAWAALGLLFFFFFNRYYLSNRIILASSTVTERWFSSDYN